MTKLKILEMGWNDFSDSSTLALLPVSLEELHLMEVSLSELPVSLTKLKNLTWIELGKNKLKRVAKDTLPPNLKFLNASINFLSDIETGALPTCLETLDLRFNNLDCTSLPADFASLTSLQSLYLHENALDCIPSGIFGFKTLETLTLHRNDNLSRLTFNTTEVAFLSRLKSFQIDQRCLETSCEKPASIGTTNYTVCLTDDPTITHNPNSNSTSTGTAGSSGSGNKALIIGLAVAIGGLVAILIGAVHWKRRRDSVNDVMRHNHGDDGKDSGSLKPLGANELHAIEEQHRGGEGASDATAYAEMTHAERHYTTTAGAVLRVSASSLSSLSTSSEKTMSETHIKITKKTMTTTTTTMSATGISSEIHAASVSTVSTAKDRTPEGESMDQSSVWNDAELLQWRVDSAAIRDVQLISSGTHGDVWLAIFMSRHVAVKRLKNTVTTQGDASSSIRHCDALHQFVQAIKLHARMDHPKIVQFLGVAWTVESDLQSVVEYMAMGDLRTFLSSLQPTFETLSDDVKEEEGGSEHYWDAAALQIAIDVAEALVYLHSLAVPVLHRDLTSHNVLLDETLRAKVTGIGVSESHVTMTQRWIAPEVLVASNTNVTSAIDVYALGILLSELDTWSVPFSEHVDVDDTALRGKIIAGELKPWFRSASPREVVALAKQCVLIDPTQRPTAMDVANTLRQCLATNQHQIGQVGVHGLAAAGRGSTSSSRASLTAVGPAMVMPQ